MKKIFLSLAGTCLLLPYLLIAQNDSRVYANSITGADLKKHLSIVASAEMEGRETASEGLKKAAAYIEAQFKLLGLKPPPGNKGNYQQAYPLYRDTVTNASLLIGDKNYVFGQDYLVDILSNPSTKMKAKKIIFVGYGISDNNYDDYAGKDVKDKIVIFFLGEPKKGGIFTITGTKETSQWTDAGMARKTALAKERGAAGAFVINPTMENLPGENILTARRTKLYYPREAVPEIPRVFDASISRQVAKDIFGEAKYLEMAQKAQETEPLNTISIESKIRTRLKYEKKKQSYSSTNVIGYLEGSIKKDEYVVITAHMDHLGKQGDQIFYGADDDGSGTVSVMELAEAFTKAKTAGSGPSRSIVFMTVSGEEKGLLGSEYYSDNPLFPLEKTTVNLNIDMVGRIDPTRLKGDSTNYIYVIGDDKLSSELKPISERINKQFSNLELDYKFNDPKDESRIYFRSDHYNFARKGVPVIFYFSGIHEDYHKVTDVIEKINFNIMEKRVRLIFHTAWELANRNEMLKRDIELPAETR
ncbi:MAG: M28 family peptidase [Chitinophagaceae bacterium]